MADLSIDLPVSVAEVARALREHFDAEPEGGDAFTGRVRLSICICERDSIWKTPIVSASWRRSYT